VPGGEGIGVGAAAGSGLAEKVIIEKGAEATERDGGGWIAKLDIKAEVAEAGAGAKVEVEVEAAEGAEAKRAEGTLEEVDGAGGAGGGRFI
jgi:hypothetical protein